MLIYNGTFVTAAVKMLTSSRDQRSLTRPASLSWMPLRIHSSLRKAHLAYKTSSRRSLKVRSITCSVLKPLIESWVLVPRRRVANCPALCPYRSMYVPLCHSSHETSSADHSCMSLISTTDSKARHSHLERHFFVLPFL